MRDKIIGTWTIQYIDREQAELYPDELSDKALERVGECVKDGQAYGYIYADEREGCNSDN